MRQLQTPRNEWDGAREARLRELFASGLSHRQIGSELGVTRNAVIGKCSRLGLVGRKFTISAPHPVHGGTRFTAPASRKGDGGLVEKVKLGVKARAALALNVPKFKRVPVKLSAAPAEFLGVALLDLQEGQCRFPRGEGPFLFCGQPTPDDQSYCRACYKIAHQPPQPRRDTSPAPANYPAPWTAWK